MNIDLDKLKYDEHGLLPAIVQDADSREVLTLAYMNAESLARTIETKETWFWSRSRNELWHKGATSGNTQQVVDLIAVSGTYVTLAMMLESGKEPAPGGQTPLAPLPAR